MAEKTLNTRLRLKYDTLDNWVAANPVLLQGEVGVVYTETTTDSIHYQPAILFKVGDGTKNFSELPWASGLAADVHEWAKKAQGDAADIIVSTVEGNAFKDKNVAEAIATLNANIGALTGSGTEGSITDMIAAAIQALDVEDTAVEGQYVSSVSEEDGKITVTRAALPDYTSDFAAKVDKKEGYSLISDTEIARLANVSNYDDSAVKTSISTEVTRATKAETALSGRIDALEAYDHSTYATKDEVNAKYTKPETGIGSDDLSASVNASLAKADSALQSTDLNDLNSKVNTLVGEDSNKSVRTIANEELAAQLIPENATEALDTLQEIAAWIQSHPEDASEMNEAIQALEAKVDTGDKNVSTYVSDAIAAENLAQYETKTDASAKLTEAKEYADSLAANYATAEQGKKADTAIQEITTTAGEGLKVSKSDTSINIDIDEETVFVLFGGNANGFTE